MTVLTNDKVWARLRAARKFEQFKLLNPELYPVEQDDDVDGSKCQREALVPSSKLKPIKKVLGPITQRNWR
jgi:hypothetical protein